MTTNIRCPDCGTMLRVPATKPGATFRCPKCSKTLRLGSAASPAQPAAPAMPPLQPPAGTTPVAASSLPPRLVHPPAANPLPANVNDDAAPLGPFLFRYGIGFGIISLLLLVLGLAGLASEPVALAASIAFVVAMVGCLMVGQVWMAVAAARRHVLLGVASLFVPIIGLVVAFKYKGRGLRGAIIYVSCVVPVLLGLIFVAMYKSRHTGAGRAQARTAKLADDRPDWEAMIRNTEQQVAADAPLETATFRFIQIGPTIPITAAQGDTILSDFQHYVKGSFNVDADAKTVSFEYRGPKGLSSQYRLMLYNQTQTMLTEIPEG